jgi:uncharacterized membrane protein YdbT with pleckstrin-like domain
MQSNLKTQYPLSPKKFWKKMIEKSILFFLLSAVFGGFGAVMFAASKAPSSSMTAVVIGGILGALVLCFAMLAVYGTYLSHYIKTYYYSDDEDFLTIKKGVFAPTEIHVQYLKIQDVFVDQDILDRILGIYDVHISSATYSSGIEAHIDGVDKAGADGLKTLFLGKMKRSSSGHMQMPSGTAPEHQTADSVSTSEPKQSVSFSSPISSEVYGLSSDWWTSELVKLAAGSIITPIIITLWFVSAANKGSNDFIVNWPLAFYIWLGVFVVSLLFRSIALYLWKTHYSYNFGDEFIYMKVGVLSVSEKNMGYNTIQDVKVNQSFIDRIFGVADVIIENASPNMVFAQNNRKIPIGANGIVIEGLKLADARKIAEEIKKVTLGKTTNSKGV